MKNMEWFNVFNNLNDGKGQEVIEADNIEENEVKEYGYPSFDTSYKEPIYDINYLIEMFKNNKGSFSDFLSSDYDGKILKIFDKEAVEILLDNIYKENMINYILVYSEYKDELFKRDYMIEFLFKTHLTEYYANIRYLSDTTKDKIIKYALDNKIDMDTIGEFIEYCDEEYQSKFVERSLDLEFLSKIFRRVNTSIQDKILNTKNIELTDLGVNLKRLFNEWKEYYLKNSSNGIYSNSDHIRLDTRFLTKKVLENIWNDYNVLDIREIINNAGFITDASIIDDYVSKMEYNLICNLDGNLMTCFSELLKLYNTFNDENTTREEKYQIKEEFSNKLFKLDRKSSITNNYPLNLNQDKEDFMDSLTKRNNLFMSNLIIDYIFKENFYNVLINVKEYLEFYYRGNIGIDEDKLYIYSNILNIDSLDVDEKLELFNELIRNNMIETFYDDIRYAKRIRNESIRDNSLTKDDIEEYKNEELSEKYGVEVDYFDGDIFYGIVKSGDNGELDALPTGHSFSLVGPENQQVFMKSDINYLYDASTLNPDQIVHVYPFDSFTLYKPFKGIETETRTVNKLYSAQELIERTKGYNEILILEEGYNEFPINSSVPKLKKIGIYCLDDIREKDILAANRENLPIILVNTKSYDKYKINRKEQEENRWDEKYGDIISKVELERKRLL